MFKFNLRTNQGFRLLFQIIFVLLCIWIGIEFHLFVKHFETNGVTPFYTRPPGVDGFLPISSLMNLFYFIQSGEVNAIHPAGFFIFISIIFMSFVFGKSFCSWLCPVGTLSERLGNLGKKIFRRNLRLPKWLDYFLRSFKYLLLGFFVYAIFKMSVTDLKVFLEGEYNIVADIRMYDFFAQISTLSTIVIAFLAVLSVIIRGFWCRFLCPYGALLGIFGLFSIHKIKRNQQTCINCSKCSKICPSLIRVDKVKTVISDECTSCYQCIDVCPVKNTLEMKTSVINRKVPKRTIIIAIVVLFIGITGLGMILDKWQNKITKERYMELYKHRFEFNHIR